MSDEILSQILRNQADAADERKNQGIMIAEIRTGLFGPTNQPEEGLMAKVRRHGERIGRIEKGIIYAMGGAGLGGGAWNFTALKGMVTGMLGNG